MKLIAQVNRAKISVRCMQNSVNSLHDSRAGFLSSSPLQPCLRTLSGMSYSRSAFHTPLRKLQFRMQLSITLPYQSIFSSIPAPLMPIFFRYSQTIRMMNSLKHLSTSTVALKAKKFRTSFAVTAHCILLLNQSSFTTEISLTNKSMRFKMVYALDVFAVSLPPMRWYGMSFLI